MKNGDPDLDVTMRTFDCAEFCKTAISYIAYILAKNYGKHRISLYCDDGLASISQKAVTIRKSL